MLLIKDDVAAAQLYHSLRSPRWYRWPLICLSEIGLFALPFPGVARRSDGSGPPASAEDARGGRGLGLVSVAKMFLIASQAQLFLHLTVVPDSALSTASMQIIGEYCVLGGIEVPGADPRWPCA